MASIIQNTTIGTAVGGTQLTGTSTPVFYSVTVKALKANGQKLYVGASGVTTGTGYELNAGEEKEFPRELFSNANQVYIIADGGSNQGVAALIL